MRSGKAANGPERGGMITPRRSCGGCARTWLSWPRSPRTARSSWTRPSPIPSVPSKEPRRGERTMNAMNLATPGDRCYAWRHAFAYADRYVSTDDAVAYAWHYENVIAEEEDLDHWPD